MDKISFDNNNHNNNEKSKQQQAPVSQGRDRFRKSFVQGGGAAPGQIPDNPPQKRNAIMFVIRVFISLGLLYLLYRAVDTEKIKSIIYGVSIPWLLAGIGAFSFAVLVSAAAWKILLIPLGLKISWPKVIKFRLISFFFNNLLPSGVAGDFWRAFVYGTEAGNPGGSFASVLADKWVSYVSLAIFAAIALVLGKKQFMEVNLFGPVLIFVILMILSIIVSIILLPWLIGRGKDFFQKFGLNNPYLIGMDSLQVYRGNKKYILYSLLITCLSPLAGVFAFYFIALSMGKSLPLLSFFVMVPLLRVINHIPVSINSFGTQDLTFVLFFAKYGLTGETSLSFSLLAHFLKFIIGIAGGACYFHANLQWMVKETKGNSTGK